MPKKVVKVLSVDGGGMRSLIPGTIMAEIESRTGKRLHELFDLFAGTSAGSLFVMAILTPSEEDPKKPKFSPQSLIDIILNDRDTLFNRSLWYTVKSMNSLKDAKYPPSSFANTFDKYAGKAMLSEALSEVIIPAYEIESSNPFFFKRSDARRDPRLDFRVYDVIDSSCSAPVYFKPHEVKPPNDSATDHYVFVDGGLVAQNPAMCAYVEAKTLFPDADEYMIVSLGTGEDDAQMLVELFDKWGAVQWVMPLINIFLGGSAGMIDYQLQTLFATTGDKLNHYYRLQTRLGDDTPIDITTDEGIHKLKIIAENLIRDNHKEIDEICDKLLKS